MGENARVAANPTVLVVQHDLDTPLAALAPPLAALGVRTVTWYALSQPEPPGESSRITPATPITAPAIAPRLMRSPPSAR